MREITRALILLLLAVSLFSAAVLADPYLESLQPDQRIHGFKVLNLYENRSGAAMGARFISEKYGFIIDIMRIQSVPQAFYWIKTPPTSSKGEPHACEHLLLGKGNRGRYVKTLEDMALGNSSAYTSQLRTCYHFNTPAGEETFYEIFEAKLQAFLHPDFTDEEIRREVCHVGISADPKDGSLLLEEKGTVYTEMVSSFEKPWYYLAKTADRLIYGDNHPISWVSGGDPSVMRSMVPQDMWSFHKRTHHLANMGAIVAIPDAIEVESFLEQMDGILSRCQKEPDSSPTVGIGAYDLPPARPALTGTVKLATYPSDKAEDPGNIVMAWPSDLELDYRESFLLNLFLSTFASGETSNLYELFINSETRKLDLGGNYVYGGFDDDLGYAIYFGISQIENRFVTESWVDSIRTLVLEEVRRLHDLVPGSTELAEFNEEAKGHLLEQAKQYDNYLNSPPMFGFRSGVGSGWLGLLETLEIERGFRKSLVLESRFAYADSLLALDKNIWADFIDHWRLLTITPYLVATGPSPEMITDAAQAKEERIAGYLADFRKKYAVEDDQEAIARYQEEFDAKTAELEALAGKQELPGFIDNPPLTLDDQLNFEVIELAAGIPLVASTFDNMTSSEVGIAMRLDVVPDSLLPYVPLLPSVLVEIGVTKDGQSVEFDDMQQRLREEVLGLNANFSHGYQTERVELVLTGRGSKLEELQNAVSWMDAALYAPLLTSDNLPRIMDVVDQSLTSYRNRMKGAEEVWVSYPVAGYRFQHNPLFMSSSCFLTQSHHMHRLKWQLTDPGTPAEQQELGYFINALTEYGSDKSRDDINAMLMAVENLPESPDEVTLTALGVNFLGLSDYSRELAAEIAQSLRMCLSDSPDENLAADWAYLCQETKEDLQLPPEVALDRINQTLNLVRKADNARLFMISSGHDRAETMPLIRKFVSRLDTNPAPRQQYANRNRVVERLRQRNPEVEKPVYVGLVHEGTSNGVLLFSAEIADRYDTSVTTMLNCLSGKLYGGGGPHGLFMKTWAAGLAYSNGYAYSQSSGRVSYYAERCPDVAETMRFVVDQLKSAEDDPSLKDYAVAQVFGFSRAPSRYEDRGEAMAADLADGITPDIVRAFREKILSLKDDDGIYRELRSRMEQAYGPVLIGYGQPLSESRNAIFFLIGPEPQFESLEQYIQSSEEEQTVYRLYPRDFWLTM